MIKKLYIKKTTFGNTMSRGSTLSLDDSVIAWPRPKKAPPRNQSVTKICTITFTKFITSQRVKPYAQGRFRCKRFIKPMRICCILSSRSFFEGTLTLSFTVISVSFSARDAMCNPDTNMLNRPPKMKRNCYESHLQFLQFIRDSVLRYSEFLICVKKSACLPSIT